jgi:glucose/arabinose dehydrogenase
MRTRIMRSLFAVLGVVCSLLALAGQSKVSAETALDPLNLQFTDVAGGLSQPVFITNAGDGSGRLFILERAGRIRIVKNGALLGTPFLDIDQIVNSAGGEQGLLALAFHPNYASNGLFYTVHTAPINSVNSVILSRFSRSAGNPDLANAGSQVTLLSIPHPVNTNHNGGTLAFGPDGYLYWSTGDGGGAGDLPNNAQNLTVLLGKILRLDVDSGSPYGIPASNPFVGDPNAAVREEIWAYGLRNPWRFSFDALTGDLYIGDVGQGAREEIDFQPASSSGGENYGWRVMEGSLCFNPASGCNTSGKVLPIAEYDHNTGCSVTGGYVYRGSRYPLLRGHYFYGDFCTGAFFSLQGSSAGGWTRGRSRGALPGRLQHRQNPSARICHLRRRALHPYVLPLYRGLLPRRDHLRLFHEPVDVLPGSPGDARRNGRLPRARDGELLTGSIAKRDVRRCTCGATVQTVHRRAV